MVDSNDYKLKIIKYVFEIFTRYIHTLNALLKVECNITYNVSVCDFFCELNCVNITVFLKKVKKVDRCFLIVCVPKILF